MTKTISKFKIPILTIILVVSSFLFLNTNQASAATCTWNAGSTDWATAGNWSCGNVPTSADDVTIDIAGNQPTIDLTSGNITINSLNIGATTASTLTFSNGFTNELIITTDLDIGGFGTITHNANPAGDTPLEGVRISVGGDAEIAENGKIDVSEKGYFRGNGANDGYGIGKGYYSGSINGGSGGGCWIWRSGWKLNISQR